jgi:hypothetical protein
MNDQGCCSDDDATSREYLLGLGIYLRTASKWKPCSAPIRNSPTTPCATLTQGDRKYFDSGDYALSQAGKTNPADIGTGHPSPERIPHSVPHNRDNPATYAPSKESKLVGEGVNNPASPGASAAGEERTS